MSEALRVSRAEFFALAYADGALVRVMAAMGSGPALLPAVAIDIAVESEVALERVLLAGWADPDAMRTQCRPEEMLAYVRTARDEYGLTMRPGGEPGSLEMVVADLERASCDTEDWSARATGGELITPDSLRWIVALEQRREVYMLADLARQVGLRVERLAGFTAGAEELSPAEADQIAAVLKRGYGLTLYREGEALVMCFSSPHLFGLFPRGDLQAA